MRAHPILALALLPALGCSAPKYAPVSGKVTLNGRPLAGAHVVFNRIPPEGSIESGLSAVGTTDRNGEFTLRVRSNQAGALVGKHRVSISLMRAEAGDTGDARAAPRREAPRNVIPARYNDKTELTFEVHAGGTDQANFDLKSP
jgi:hypothetical protein